jgi:dTDP-4-amino-4,6-dideoxygalactose transaminase
MGLDVRPIRALPPLSPAVYLRAPARNLPFPLQEPECRLFHSGRYGLRQAVASHNLEPRSEILAPAYHCGSEIAALESAGMVCRFYEGTDELAPDPSELDALLGPRVRGLHLIHYLGFPQQASRWREWCDARGLLLVEDAAQAWLSSYEDRPVGSVGDIALFSLYKMLALPDGGAVIAMRSWPQQPAACGPALGRAARLHASWLLRQLPIVGPLRRSSRALPSSDPHAGFILGNPDTAPSRITRILLPRLIDAGAAARRRRNYRVLLDAIGDRVPPPFTDLPDGACPFLFPAETSDKFGLIDRLARSGIQGIDFWSEPHPSLPTSDFPRAAWRRARTVGLPVHHELRESDLRRIIQVMRSDSHGPALGRVASSGRGRRRVRVETLSRDGTSARASRRSASACV